MTALMSQGAESSSIAVEITRLPFVAMPLNGFHVALPFHSFA